MPREPTYEVEGLVERFDRTQTAFVRSESHFSRVQNQVSRAVYDALFSTTSALAPPQVVDGEPAPKPVDRDEHKSSAALAQFALSLGAAEVRFGPMRREWLYRPEPESPDHDLENVAVLAFPQVPQLIGTGSSPATQFEVGRVYARAAQVAVQVARYIRGLGDRARAHHLRSTLILMVPAAVDAGIGELARCGYVVSRRFGANFRISCVTTDMPLDYDPPVDLGLVDFCSKCRKCATTCPAGAIPEGDQVVANGIRRWVIDPDACLGFWHKTGYPCAICQAVCPWTKPQTFLHRTAAALAVNVPAARPALVKADDLVYGAGFKPAPIPDWLK